MFSFLENKNIPFLEFPLYANSKRQNKFYFSGKMIETVDVLTYQVI